LWHCRIHEIRFSFFQLWCHLLTDGIWVVLMAGRHTGNYTNEISRVFLSYECNIEWSWWQKGILVLCK
jgi:hypothetical protein